MAYIVPIHKPTSVRHALKLCLLDSEQTCLVVACVFPTTLARVPQLMNIADLDFGLVQESKSAAHLPAR